MPGCKGQHGAGRIELLIKVRSPAHWQVVRHGSAIRSNEPRSDDVIPARHSSRRPCHDCGAEGLRGVHPEHAQRPETGRRPFAEGLDRLAAGTSEHWPGLIRKIDDHAALATSRPELPLAWARHWCRVDHCRHPSCPWIGSDELSKARTYLRQGLGRRHGRTRCRADLFSDHGTKLS